MDRLPLLRVAEVAFLSPKLKECVEFYTNIGLQYTQPIDPTKIQFANVGEQLFGFADKKRGFIDGYGGFLKTPLHVAFEVPGDKLDECIAFLNSKGVKTSPKIKASDWHGARVSWSVYFADPMGHIIELWARSRDNSFQTRSVRRHRI